MAEGFFWYYTPIKIFAQKKDTILMEAPLKKTWWFRSIPWIVRHVGGPKGRTKGLGPGDNGVRSRLGFQLRSRRLELFSTQHGHHRLQAQSWEQVVQLGGEIFGKVGWFFYNLFCVDGYIINFFFPMGSRLLARFEADRVPTKSTNPKDYFTFWTWS